MGSYIIIKGRLDFLNKWNGYFTKKNYLQEQKCAMSDIHPCTFDLGLTVRDGAS